MHDTSARLVALALVIVSAMVTRPVAAAPSEDPRAAEARRACATGQVDRGVDLLASIIAESGDPSAVYNQARCYQQNGRPEEALNRFREYLRIGADEKPADRRKAERFIAELEAELEAKANRTTPVAPAAPGAEGPLPMTPEAIPSPGVAAGSDTGTASTPVLRMISYGAATVGVLGLGFGLSQSLRVRSIQNELDELRENPSAPPITQSEYDGRVASGNKAATRQWIGYGVGAVSLAGAAVLYWLSLPEDRPAVTVAPGMIDGRLAFGLVGRY